MSEQKVVHVIVNPAAGSGAASEFIDTNVEPLLRASGWSVNRYETKSIGDAARIAREIAQDGNESADRTAILAGGDGTAHEFIEGIYGLRKEGGDVSRWELAIVPVGTANALYASTYPPSTPLPTFFASLKDQTSSLAEEVLSKLQSVAALLDPTRKAKPLPISTVSLNISKSSTPTLIPSHVVISTCLHANLLATAEGLRKEYPGIERFKVAAQSNAGKFFPARIDFTPTAKGSVEVYDPISQTFISVDKIGGETGDGSVCIKDDFVYLLSSASCPRLEPTFEILPLLSRLPPSEGSMDVLIIRPGKDSRIQAKLAEKGYKSIQEVREAGDKDFLKSVGEVWIPRAWEVIGTAYQGGSHVDLTYTIDGEVEMGGKGNKVVEVYRCGGFDWTPTVKEDTDSHLVCADGSLIHAQPGSTVSVRLDAQDEGQEGICLWA